MQLSTKHPAGQMVEYADFTGGLNTAVSVEGIAQNELAVAVNVTIDKGTGLLRTVYGFDRVAYDSSITFDCLMYDKASKTVLVTDTASTLYRVDSGVFQPVGRLTGRNHARYANWEDGILISSGGRLQYYHGGTLETISESPSNCNGVFVRDGRVWTWSGTNIYLSEAGNEHGWSTDTNALSSAQWVEVGYKDTGNISCVVPTLSMVLVFKDGGNMYRIDGQFPSWQATLIATQIPLDNSDCCISIGSGVTALGGRKLRSVTGNEYGDMQAQSLSEKVQSDVASYGSASRIRYVSKDNSIWIMERGKSQALVYDVALGSFFYHQYTTEVLDVMSVGEDVYTLRAHSLCVRNQNALMVDEGASLPWAFECKALSSQNYLLLTRIIADTTPLFEQDSIDQRFWVGGVMLNGSVPHDGTLWDRHLWSKSTLLTAPLESEPSGDNKFASFIRGSHSYIRTPKTYRAECRCVDRRRALRVRAEGSGGATMFNRIAAIVAEV